jgi:peptidoglycan/xylan/chitin deacetylase (PgdA/CDA1 family)
LKTSAGAVADTVGLADAYAFLKRKYLGSQVVILIYHRVCTRKTEWSFASLSPQSFEKQVKYLSENFEMLSLDELVSQVRQHRILPRTVAVITIDDGYRDNYVNAYPILKRYRSPVTVFLTTGHIGTDNPFWWDKVGYAVHNTSVTRLDLGEAGQYALGSDSSRNVAATMITENLKKLPEQRKNLLIDKLLRTTRVGIPKGMGNELILSWDEVRQMSADGIAFGAHTVTHPILTRVPLEQARWEIAESKKIVEAATGRKANFFSYPCNKFSDEVVRTVAMSGFMGAVVSNQKWVTSATDPYRLGRIGATEDFGLFKIVLSGLRGDLGRP